MSGLANVALFAACATLSALIVEGLAIRASYRDAREALGSFRYGKLTPKGRRVAARVCRVALDMGRALGLSPETYARGWMSEWWERLIVSVELPPEPPKPNDSDKESPNADD